MTTGITFNPGRIVKMKPGLIPEGASDTDQFGTLGYPGELGKLKMQIIRVFRDEDALPGVDLLEVKVMHEKWSNCIVLSSDVVMSSDKLTLDYAIIKDHTIQVDERPTMEAKVKKLIEERTTLKKTGIGVGDTKLRNNWAEIQRIRKAITMYRLSNKRTIVIRVPAVPGQLLTLENVTPDLAKKDIDNTVLSFISNYRNSLRKTSGLVIKDYFGYQRTLLGGVATEEGFIAKISVGLRDRILQQAKNPTTDNKYVGVEVEFFSRLQAGDIRKKLCEMSLHRFVQLTTDASLRPDRDGYVGHELRVLASEQDMVSVLSQVGKFLASAKAYVNGTCGLHVHLDMRKRDVATCYHNFFMTQKALIQANPHYRIEGRYCRPIPDGKFSNIDGLGGSRDERRRRVVNGVAFAEHKTLEIRVHEGSVDMTEVTEWCKLLVYIASLDSKLKAEITNGKQLLAASIGSSSTAKYLDDRISKFASEFEGYDALQTGGF